MNMQDGFDCSAAWRQLRDAGLRAERRTAPTTWRLCQPGRARASYENGCWSRPVRIAASASSCMRDSATYAARTDRSRDLQACRAPGDPGLFLRHPSAAAI